jgi:hypothetical protein
VPGPDEIPGEAMNDLELTSKEIAEIRLKYPPGTRLMLIIMEDSYAVPSGTRGTVDHVDDVGRSI